MNTPQLVPQPSRLRWLWLLPAALLMTWLLFLLMYQAIRSKDVRVEPVTIIDAVRVVQATRDKDTQQDPMQQLQSSPPPPPAAPPSLAQPALPTLALPTMSSSPIEVGSIAMPVGVTIGGGATLGGSGVFGGFAGGGSGGTGSGTGNGAGNGAGYGGGSWKGKPLVPLSTARPQMPDWACKQKLAGWVEAVFVVDLKGHTRDIRIADAEPKGVYEAAAIESIANWLYEPPGAMIEVRQRVPMDPADCAYNYH